MSHNMVMGETVPKPFWILDDGFGVPSCSFLFRGLVVNGVDYGCGWVDVAAKPEGVALFFLKGWKRSLTTSARRQVREFVLENLPAYNPDALRVDADAYLAGERSLELRLLEERLGARRALLEERNSLVPETVVL